MLLSTLCWRPTQVLLKQTPLFLQCLVRSQLTTDAATCFACLVPSSRPSTLPPGSWLTGFLSSTGVVVGLADCVGLIIFHLLYVRVPHLLPEAHVCKRRALTSSAMQGEKANPNSRLMRLYGPLVRSSSGDSGLSGLAPKGYMVPLLTVGSHG